MSIWRYGRCFEVKANDPAGFSESFQARLRQELEAEKARDLSVTKGKLGFAGGFLRFGARSELLSFVSRGHIQVEEEGETVLVEYTVAYPYRLVQYALAPIIVFGVFPLAMGTPMEVFVKMVPAATLMSMVGIGLGLGLQISAFNTFIKEQIRSAGGRILRSRRPTPKSVFDEYEPRAWEEVDKPTLGDRLWRIVCEADGIADTKLLKINASISALVLLGHGGAVAAILWGHTERPPGMDIIGLAAFTLPLAALILVTCLLGHLKRDWAARVLILHGGLLAAGAIALLAWVAALLMGPFPGGNFNWAPGTLTVTCVYPVYLLRRALPRERRTRGSFFGYVHIWVLPFVVVLDVAGAGKMLHSFRTSMGIPVREMAAADLPGPEVLPSAQPLDEAAIRGPRAWKNYVLAVQKLLMNQEKPLFNEQQLAEFWATHYPKLPGPQHLVVANKSTAHLLFSTSDTGIISRPGYLLSVSITGPEKKVMEVGLLLAEHWADAAWHVASKPGEWHSDEVARILNSDGALVERSYRAGDRLVLCVKMHSDFDRDLAKPILQEASKHLINQ